ncbi:MAG: FmdB family transcriptional regulator [Cellulomonas sp.]|nr:FmdB family transcriptional regulator [Cellulomonas sp.]
MPTYAYACTACDHRFEAQQSFTESSLTICPECAGRLRKVFPSVGVVFKGSGFYRNDSRSTNHGKINASSTTSHGDSGSSDGSSDSSSSNDSSTSSSSTSTPAATPSTPAAPASGGGASSGSGSKVAASSGASTSK